ncbi:MAG: uncharacterized protein KVP18_004950 [Porospora cf. gigantea A]|uniref:uncharacterized protein n=1 Tax=Porospora cf. gigantea A TaxID=2853593 RepID=UPI00355AC373|nr:MAG: hypothetical protein KVP18_004950 [Porospora cf. gigantea A]
MLVPPVTSKSCRLTASLLSLVTKSSSLDLTRDSDPAAAPRLLQQPECPYLIQEASTENAFLKMDLKERQRRIWRFWSGVYRSQESRWGPVLPSKKLLEVIPADCDLTGAEKGFLFACICGLGPMFELDPQTGRLRNTDKGVSADFSLFNTCNIAMLEKLSAWHWLQMHDEGLLEPTSNPSVLLSCLGLNDRLQYLREMTSTRSVPWLEQARWLAVDCMGEASSQSRMEIVQSITSDMSMLLQLLEELDKEGSERILKRNLIIMLFLNFLGCEPTKHTLVDYRMVAHGTSQAFCTIRCGLLNETCHQQDHSRLLSATMASLQTVSRGWATFGRNLGVNTTVVPASTMLFGLQQLDGGGFYPLFLNPHALCRQSWNEAKCHPGIRDFPCFADSTNFTDLSHAFGEPVRESKHSTCLTDLLSFTRTSDRGCDSHPNCQRKSDRMRFVPLRARDLAFANDGCAVVRQLRKLEAVRQVVTRFPGCFNLMLHDLSLPEADISRLRRQLVVALLLGLGDEAIGDIEDVEATDNEGTGAAFFLRTNALCFCQHSFLPFEERSLAVGLMLRFATRKRPAWSEVEQTLTDWWKTLQPVRPTLYEIEGVGYDQHPSDDWGLAPKKSAAKTTAEKDAAAKKLCLLSRGAANYRLSCKDGGTLVSSPTALSSMFPKSLSRQKTGFLPNRTLQPVPKLDHGSKGKKRGCAEIDTKSIVKSPSVKSPSMSTQPNLCQVVGDVHT